MAVDQKKYTTANERIDVKSAVPINQNSKVAVRFALHK